ncbi:hypothetical protein [Roseovarius aestuariivivens]|uniref:hypothetical protein n=1 Tax=Roseovarius aestuariivivens TaxID=1888910 RepID=UPI001436A3A5|nr:hypothetical protein [Roseovarius aestuariivivens]
MSASLTSAASATTFYFDEATYFSATGAVAVPLPNLGNVGSTFSTGGLTFSSFGSATDLFSGTSGFEGTFGPDFAPAISGNDLAISGPENFAIDFGSSVAAFSFKAFEPTVSGPASPFSGPTCNAPCFDTSFDISLFRQGVKITNVTFFPFDDTPTFLGILEPGGFDRVVFTDLTGTVDNEFFGEFSAAGLSTVPAPAPLVLLASCLGILGFCRRRRNF